MEDATQIIDPGTPEYPLDAGLAVQAETCPHCQTTIPPGEQFCPTCGFQRGSWGEVAGAAAAEVAHVELGDAPWLLRTQDGAEYPLHLGEVIAGRGEVPVKLADGFVSRNHGCFTVTADSVTYADLGSSNGSFLGEQRLTPDEAHELSDGGLIKLGQTELTLIKCEITETPDEAAQPDEATEAETGKVEAGAGGEDIDSTPAEAAVLTEAAVMVEAAESCWSLKRVGTDEVFYLRFGESVLGRKADHCDHVLRGDGYVSGKHARIVATETTLELADMGSTNGTFFGDDQLAPDVLKRLSPGDVVRLGQTELEVQYNELGDADSGE